MGEFDSIGWIRSKVEKSADDSLLSLGIGDDCCLLDCPGTDRLAMSTDTVVEGVHFSTRWLNWSQAALRASAAALSDLAAMAAEPVCMLAAASVPKSGGDTVVKELAVGLLDAASRWNCPLAGGDLTSTSGPVTLTLTVVGKCRQGMAVKRSGAAPGEEIWITDECGDPAAAVNMLEQAGEDCAAVLEDLPQLVRDRLLSPAPRLAEAAELLELGPPSSMIDVSDGVAADLGHILEESGCGAVLVRDSLPAGEFSRHRARQKGLDDGYFFLYGGEDFQLLFTLPSGTLEGPSVSLSHETRITRIGRTTGTAGELMIENKPGVLVPLDKKGYDHLE